MVFGLGLGVGGESEAEVWERVGSARREADVDAGGEADVGAA